MKKHNILLSLIFILSCGGCIDACGDVWESSLRNKVCGANPQTATKIRTEFLINVGYHRKMRFNTPDKVYLFWDKGITIVNATNRTVSKIQMPLRTERDYFLGGYALSGNNEAIMAGFYNQNSASCNVIFYIDADHNIADIIPIEYKSNDRNFEPFFYNGYLYCAVRTWDNNTGTYSIYNLLKFSLTPEIQMIEDIPIDVRWAGGAYISNDNFVWSYNSNTRSDPIKIIFSFDGENYTYYGPGKNQNGPNGSYAIDSNNIFIGCYSGVVWQYMNGAWKKHAICREDEPGYSVETIWASSPNNVFIAGSSDVFSEQNFAYHYDGSCWTRWFKGDGYINISHILGTPDGSVVLALDDEGDLYRLWVE